MNTAELSEYCVQPGATVRDAAECINRNRRGIALVVDDDLRVMETVTDGDIRRAVLSGVALTESVAYLRAFKSRLYQSPTVAPVGSTRARLIQIMQERNVRQLPLVDHDGRLVDLVTLDDTTPAGPVEMQAVVMAGGFGTRLHPLTEDMPKPMLPVGGRPLLEHIIGGLRDTGIRRVHVSTHFQPEKIREHFGDGEAFGVAIDYVQEQQPLGTAGALGIMPPPTERTLVLNGDVLSNVDYRALLDFHLEYHGDLTVAVRKYDLEVPYGVVECQGPDVTELTEKPVYTFFVNAGIYLLEPAVFSLVPTGSRMDMPDLIRLLLDSGHRVVSFPVVEYWLDIGRHGDYAQAEVDANNRMVSRP